MPHVGSVSGMSDRVLIAVAAAVISVLAVMLIAGHGPWAGKTLLTISDEHGLNAGDLPVLAAWVAGVSACAVLWRRR